MTMLLLGIKNFTMHLHISLKYKFYCWNYHLFCWSYSHRNGSYLCTIYIELGLGFECVCCILFCFFFNLRKYASELLSFSNRFEVQLSWWSLHIDYLHSTGYSLLLLIMPFLSWSQHPFWRTLCHQIGSSSNVFHTDFSPALYVVLFSINHYLISNNANQVF